MLKKDTIDKIKGYGFDVDKLIAAVKDEKEVDYAVPEFEALTTDQLATRDAGKIAEGEKKAEPELRKTFVKEVSTRLGFTPKGERIGDLVTDLQAKINATGDDKVKSLQDQVVLLTKDKDTLTEQLGTEKQNYSKVRFETDLISHLPATRNTKALRDDERVLMLTRDITFEEVDGKRVAKRNGEIIKDPKTHAPLPVPDVVKLYATERGWDKEAASGGAGGRGGGSDGGGGGSAGLKKFSQVKEQWKKDNPDGNPNSPEFTTHLNKIAKETPDFDMYG